YNTEKALIEYPEYGRSIQEMLQYARTIESRPHRQKTVEAIIGLMMQLVPPGSNRNMDDYREKLWNHAFAIAGNELDVTPPPGIAIIREEERPKPEPIGYPASATRFRHYGNSIQALIKKAIEMPDGPKKEGFVEVIASYMKLAYKTWNKEHYVSDDIVKDDLEMLSDGQLVLHEGYESLDRLAAGAGRHDKDRRFQNQRNNRNNKPNNSGGGRNKRNNRGGGGGGGNFRKRKK
ncbi:MAG TPA: DUF4290 domain-containing protein, partial [Saprospiraceae bacterium]|nr:DUF4290 domain-containing protein [Saprospiraceae bacterium]